jgi:hypothetical protein
VRQRRPRGGGWLADRLFTGRVQLCDGCLLPQDGQVTAGFRGCQEATTAPACDPKSLHTLCRVNVMSIWCTSCRYMTYGETEWREATEACLKRMELYDETSERGCTAFVWALYCFCCQPFLSGGRQAIVRVYHLQLGQSGRSEKPAQGVLQCACCVQRGTSLSTRWAGSPSGPARAPSAWAPGGRPGRLPQYLLHTPQHMLRCHAVKVVLMGGPHSSGVLAHQPLLDCAYRSAYARLFAFALPGCPGTPPTSWSRCQTRPSTWHTTRVRTCWVKDSRVPFAAHTV